MINVDNAVIMAAGTSSRFAPLSYERPKGLIEVKGEILIERQIEQLIDAGVHSIIVVTGYKAEMFMYLEKKYGVKLIHNDEFSTRNNNGSIYAVKDYLNNSYICSSDNYFSNNPFEKHVSDPYYAVLYAEGETAEWCVNIDENDWITSVEVGGKNSWYMLGHVFFDQAFTHTFLKILTENYNNPEYVGMYWEGIYKKHINKLKLKVRRYSEFDIFEFDSLDELRLFDKSYVDNTRSEIIKEIVQRLGCAERDIIKIFPVVDSQSGEVVGCKFMAGKQNYEFLYQNRQLRRM